MHQIGPFSVFQGYKKPHVYIDIYHRPGRSHAQAVALIWQLHKFGSTPTDIARTVRVQVSEVSRILFELSTQEHSPRTAKTL